MKELIRRWKEKRNLKRVIGKADHAYRTTGKQHFVVKVDNLKGVDYMVTNRELNKQYNRAAKKMNRPQVNINTMLNTAVYKTGGGTLSIVR